MVSLHLDDDLTPLKGHMFYRSILGRNCWMLKARNKLWHSCAFVLIQMNNKAIHVPGLRVNTDGGFSSESWSVGTSSFTRGAPAHRKECTGLQFYRWTSLQMPLMPLLKSWGTGGADSWSNNPLVPLNGRRGCLKRARCREWTSAVVWGWNLVRSYR